MTIWSLKTLYISTWLNRNVEAASVTDLYHSDPCSPTGPFTMPGFGSRGKSALGQLGLWQPPGSCGSLSAGGVRALQHQALHPPCRSLKCRCIHENAIWRKSCSRIYNRNRQADTTCWINAACGMMVWYMMRPLTNNVYHHVGQHAWLFQTIMRHAKMVW